MPVTHKSSINRKHKGKTAMCSEKTLVIKSILEEFPSLSSSWAFLLVREILSNEECVSLGGAVHADANAY